ncbi:Transposase DDE domain protein [compost metagenome]
MFAQTRFSQLLHLVPREFFRKAVQQSGGDRYAKRFSSWDLLVTLIYGQLHQVKSLRTLATAFSSLDTHHYHLNARSMGRSTLSDALRKRSSEPFRLLCEELLKGVSRQQRQSCQQMISLIDSTSITLRGPGFDEWTQATRTRITQGLKVHVVLDPQQYAPTYAHITPANVNDLTDALQVPLQAGMTYVFDKGYCDYNWWHQIDQSRAYFVTRLKRNAHFRLVAQPPLRADDQGCIVSDQHICLSKKHLNGKRINQYRQQPVRRIEVVREDHDTPLVLVTNDLTRSAREIADLYRQRWQIELFFKWLKQKLNLKRYLGFSENAVRLQIYSALITYLLMSLYRTLSAFSGSVSELAIKLAHSLLERPAIAGRRSQEHARKRDRWQRQLPLPTFTGH